MKRFFFCCLSLALAFGLSGPAQGADSGAPPLVQTTLDRIAVAGKLCDQTTMVISVETEVLPRVGRRKKKAPPTTIRRIKERPVALCALNEADQSWHVILLAIPYPVPETYKSCVRKASSLDERRECVFPFRVITPGYSLEHLGGYGITRLSFNAYLEEKAIMRHGDEPVEITKRGARLTVYRMRYTWFDDAAAASQDADRIIATARAINYTPFHADFMHPELVRYGFNFLRSEVQGALRELRDDGVRSRAYPAQLLADVVPWEIPLALAAIEQSDDKKFDADPRGTIESVFVEYALNGKEAFMWSSSDKSAIGALQFTNRPSRNYPGTYQSVVKRCHGAGIDPEFMRGAQDLRNVIKAAICLIDMEVEAFPAIQDFYAKNPRLGGIYPVAAYNGSPYAARVLAALVKKGKIVIRTVADGSLPRGAKDAPSKKGKKKVKRQKHEAVILYPETRGYVKKYIYLLNYLSGLDTEE